MKSITLHKFYETDGINLLEDLTLRLSDDAEKYIDEVRSTLDLHDALSIQVKRDKIFDSMPYFIFDYLSNGEIKIEDPTVLVSRNCIIVTVNPKFDGHLLIEYVVNLSELK